MEALTCLCEHPSVIKFFAIHINTMEAYTLWWNRGTLREMLDYNMKYFPIMDDCTLSRQGGPNMEGRTWLVTFRQNCVKLAWAFIYIKNVVHHCGILHNDLSKDNIMLHFLPNKPNVVYILCAIGVKLSACKKRHHHCVGLQRSKMPPMQRKCIGGLPRNCFFIYNELKTTNSP
jgi:hypothetical protein